MSALFTANQCHVYRIPPRTSNAGYRASEWGDTNAPLWSGRLRVLGHVDTCEIRMDDRQTGVLRVLTPGELFAACPYDVSGKSVEAVLDSSRYFVLRVETDGDDGAKRHAYIGVGVGLIVLTRSSKNAAKVSTLTWRYKIGHGVWHLLTDSRHKAALRSANDETSEADSTAQTPSQDWTLSDGETMQLHMPTHMPRTSESRDQARGGFVLPPPPPAGRRK